MVYLLVLAGFGVALRALLPGDVLFSSTMRTSLTLFQGALGSPNFDFEMDSDSPFAYLSIFLFVVYITISFIVLLSFVIAHMTVSG